MKKVFTLSSLLLFTFSIWGQKSLQGIYLSRTDLKNNKVSFSPVQGKKYRLILHEFLFYKPTIKVIIGDSSYTFDKDSIFGYRDRENNIHHFYEKTNYEVLNPQDTILLYRSLNIGGYKGTQIIEKYFFSPFPYTKVYALTLWNLKKAFPNNTFFHELLDVYFKFDTDLIEFDNFNKMYKLIRLYHFSMEFILNK